MIRTRSLRWLWVGIVLCVVIGAVVLFIISGTLAVSAQLWDMDSASDLEIGTEQQQVITNIEVLGSNKPVKLHVGDLVNSGAKLDHNASSYKINVDKKTNSSEVYIQNPNSSNATIVISASAIPSPGRFDLTIENLDTTNVSLYNEGSKVNRAISYTAKQGGKNATVEFGISSPDSVRFKSDTYNESSRYVFYDYSTNGDTDISSSVTIWEKNQNGGVGKKIKTVGARKEEISLKNTNIGGKTEIIIGLHSSPDKHGSDTIYALDTTTIDVSVPAQVINSPLYYRRSSGGMDSNSTLLFEFNTNISRSQGSITTNFSNNHTVSIHLTNHSESYEVDGEFLYIYPLKNSNISTQNIQPEIEGTKVENIVSTSNNSPFTKRLISPVRVDNLISNREEYTVNQDSNIGFRLDPQHEYEISKPNGSSVRQINPDSSDSIHNIDTDNLSPGYYSLNSDSENKKGTIQLVKPSIHLETSGTVNGSQIPIHVGSDGTNRTGVLNLLNSDGTVISGMEIMLNNASNTSRYIPVSQPGSYTVQVRDLNTKIKTTQNVEVVKDRTPTLRPDIPERLSIGSHLSTVLNSTYEHSSISLTSTNNTTTTTLELATTETGPTPVTVNTYASPDSRSEFVTTGSGITVESVSGDTAPLSPGTYNLTLRSEHGTEVANDTATVTVEPRSTSDLTAYTTRAVAPGEFENATAVREAIEDGTLAPATTAAANDTVVYAVNATGLTGLPAAANASLERGADLDALDGLSFGVAPTGTDDGNESAGGDALGRTPNGSAVHLDRKGLYLVADGERAFGTETLPEPGETFAAGFRVDDDRLRRTAADDRHRATTRLTYAAPDPTDGGTDTRTGDGSTEASAATGSAALGSTGTAGGSGSAGGGSAGGGSAGGSSAGGGSAGGGSAGGSSAGGGSAGGSSAGGGSTGDPSESGGAAGSAGSAGAVTDAGGPSPPEGSTGSEANRPTPRPGVGVSNAPGTSEIPPSAGPPALFGTGGPNRGAGGSAAGSRPENGRSNDAGGGESDDAASTGPADSPASSASRDPSESSDSAADEADASDLGYDEAPIRSTAYDLPGFDAVASLAAVAGASLLARRRGRGS